MDDLLKLPREVLAEISLYFIEHQDIFSFSFACKALQAASFSLERSLAIYRGDNGFYTKYNLTQSLSNLRSLSVTSYLPAPMIDFIVRNLSGLSTLHKLKRLTLEYSMEYKNGPFMDEVLSIAKMTWLEHLSLRYPVRNAGDILKNHSRLTSLHTWQKVEDFEKMPHQLKHLSLLSEDDDAIRKIFQFTSLTSLDLGWIAIKETTLQFLSNLSNLESIRIAERDWQGLDWNVLKKLPKLRSLTDEFHNNYGRLSILPDLARLTSLALTVWPTTGLPTQLLSLTELRELTLTGFGDDEPVDLSPLVHLTRLKYPFKQDSEFLNPLPNLKFLHVSYVATTMKTRIFDNICEVKTLEQLEIWAIRSEFDYLDPLTEALPKLKTLKYLRLNFTPDRKLCRSFRKLLKLRKLVLYDVPGECISVMQKRTQLVALWIVALDAKIGTLRKQLPYAVYQDKYPN